MTIYQIIESIAADPSTNAKKAILESNKNNTNLARCFYYAYNPRFNYWIKAKVQPRVVGKNDIDTFTFVVLDTLINREVTGDAARAQVEKFMGTLTAEAQEILVRIINHDLRCGASDTLAMKVWPKLVPEYPVMLCSKFNVKTEAYLKKFEDKDAFNIGRKCDGGRCLVKVDEDGIVSYHSRNGSTLELYKQFDQQFSKFKNYVFDGELLALKADGSVESRKVSNGLYTKCVRNTLSEAEAKTLSIVVWDGIPAAEYLAGIGTEPYSERLQYLNRLKYFWENSPVSVVENKNVSTLAECFEFYDAMRARGEEGAIIKLNSGIWEDARSKNAVKLKAEETGDFLCTGVELGQGKYAGMIGNLICETSDGKVKFGVGTGLKDADRDPAILYVGKIVECKYNELITSKGKSTYSVFLPVFVQIRHDKSVANSLEELK